MKKILLVVGLLCLAGTLCFAAISKSRFRATKSEKEFDVMYYESDTMTEIKAVKNKDVHVNQAYRLQKDGIKGEVRYSLFTDIGDKDEDPYGAAYVWFYMKILDVSGTMVARDKIGAYPASDAKQKFNADGGFCATVTYPESSFAKGYDALYIDCLYKQGQGLVLRTFLFNDLEFMGLGDNFDESQESLFSQNYDSFKFMERDESGKYIG